ncbi:Aldo/keto reductase [Dacryopinax primogenitus]|uniref:Aldo/keto reductase n=1 Tax=Dacryopinax primogenitus (strain DJM 731) TaxID=1858805 RepID=M5FSA1_DACPD|nr:Aldo/keto reductase [Dacryopinax primogenitus]EJT98044.1 Aldo/keto reductase [Dacryopinax primogenitus]
MSMPTRRIANTDVSTIGFGAMGIGGVTFGPTGMTLDERPAVLDRAYDLGCAFWDTANVYGDSEILIGEWFKQNPEKGRNIFLATKFGFVVDEHGVTLDLSPKAARECCDKSLKNLGVDYIDLVDPKVPIEITVGAMADLAKEAYNVYPIAAVQLEYAPITLDMENPQVGILSTCRELGIAVVPWSPLAKGVLIGQYKSPNEFPEGDLRRFTPRFSAENFTKLLRL